VFGGGPLRGPRKGGLSVGDETGVAGSIGDLSIDVNDMAGSGGSISLGDGTGVAGSGGGLSVFGTNVTDSSLSRGGRVVSFGFRFGFSRGGGFCN
jgi:hypothetical protein